MENTGRNDPCPCGSGKKYKKCCMNKSFLQRKQATVLKQDPKANSTIAKISALSQNKGVANLFQKTVMPNVDTPHTAKSLKGKVSVGKPISNEEKTD